MTKRQLLTKCEFMDIKDVCKHAKSVLSKEQARIVEMLLIQAYVDASEDAQFAIEGCYILVIPGCICLSAYGFNDGESVCVSIPNECLTRGWTIKKGVVKEYVYNS